MWQKFQGAPLLPYSQESSKNSKTNLIAFKKTNDQCVVLRASFSQTASKFEIRQLEIRYLLVFRQQWRIALIFEVWQFGPDHHITIHHPSSILVTWTYRRFTCERDCISPNWGIELHALTYMYSNYRL
jgi:hypothetical protein